MEKNWKQIANETDIIEKKLLAAEKEYYEDLENRVNLENYMVRSCTAIALCDEEQENYRQEAVFVAWMEDGATCERVYFNHPVPTTDEELKEMIDNGAEDFDPLYDEHHLLIDGLPYREYYDRFGWPREMQE